MDGTVRSAARPARWLDGSRILQRVGAMLMVVALLLLWKETRASPLRLLT